MSASHAIVRASVFVLLLSASSSGAQSTPPRASDDTIDRRSSLSITVGGGGSLGAYEAGYLYYFVETLKRNPEITRLRVATGTSAGSLNALLSLMSSCTPPNDRPESSNFYEAWTRTTLDALHDEDASSSHALLSRRPMYDFMDTLEERWDEGLPESCDVLLGVPVTRRRAYEVSLHGDQRALPRTEERFVVRIRGRGPGTTPSLENYQDTDHGFALALLPVDGDPSDEFGYLRNLLFASGAYPFVFAPVMLSHCMANVGRGESSTCTPELAESALFVDGGVFDNQPLRLAVTIARSGFVDEASPESLHRFRERPDVRIHEIPRRTFFVELDPQSYAFPDRPTEEGEPEDDLVDEVLSLASAVFEGMRSQEIQTLLESYPEIRDVVRPSSTYYPPIASLLGNFFGFVDRKLADFDFVLGMHDARTQLEEELFPAFVIRANDEVSRVTFPELDASSGVARRFECMRAFFDGIGDPAALCSGNDLRSFRAALQVTIERLYSNCARYAEDTTEAPDSRCRAAMSGAAPPRVVRLRRGEHWRLPGASQSNASRAAILRLAAYGFHFSDLGLEANESDRVLIRLRDRLGAVSRDFIGQQHVNHQLLDVVVRAALNSIEYAPPHVIGHFVIGPTSELGVSVGSPYGRVSFLRASFALELGGLDTMLGVDRYAFRLAPSGGFEIESTRLSSPIFQFRLGARVGYSFTTADRFGRRACSALEADQATCSRMIVTTYVAASLLEFVRFQLAFSFRPALGNDLRFGWSFGPALGLELRSRR